MRRAALLVIALAAPARADVAACLDKAPIQHAVRSHMREVRACYERALERDPAREGTLTVRFTVLSTGQVGSAEVSSSDLDDPAMEQCVVEAVRRWRFPATQGGRIAVSYPFRFR